MNDSKHLTNYVEEICSKNISTDRRLVEFDLRTCGNIDNQLVIQKENTHFIAHVHADDFIRLK